MNLNTTMKKLQRAILSTGLVIKIGTSQFYSPEQERMITMWILSTPTLQNGRNGWSMRDYEILRKDGRMSKGIIVTDEIPENCFHCGIKRRPSGMSFPEDMVCGITGQSVYQYNPHNLTGDKPDWCPIRPIPEKKEIRGITFSSGYAEWNLNGQDRGWNDCIDELLKDGG